MLKKKIKFDYIVFTLLNFLFHKVSKQVRGTVCIFFFSLIVHSLHELKLTRLPQSLIYFFFNLPHLFLYGKSFWGIFQINDQ